MTGLLDLARALAGRGGNPASVTARVEVHREGSLALYRYGAPRDGAPSAHPPVVLAYSLVNRPTVLDLLPDRSVVRSLLAAGLDVYLADWGEPGLRESRLDLAGHVLRLGRAVRRAADLSGHETASVLGYCLGGTLGLALAAIEPALVDRLALLATPVVFHDGGLLGAWARGSGLDPAALACTSHGNVSGVMSRELLRFQDPVGQWKKWTTLAERAFDGEFVRAFLAQEAWANDAVDLPGRAFADVITLLYREDRLAKGTWEIGGRPVRLEEVTAPVLNLLSSGDKIVPGDCTEPVAALVSPRAHVETLRVSGGHIGMTVGRRARETTHAALSRFLTQDRENLTCAS